MTQLTKSQEEVCAFIESEIKDYSDLDYARFKFALALAWGAADEYVVYWRDQVKRLQDRDPSPLP